jgi:glycosyltransferase involved in cell wall biosynthesis
MHLAFNATALLSPLTGIGQYSYHLAAGLMEQEGLEVDYFYGAYWSSQLRNSPAGTLAASLPWLRRHIPYSYELRRWLQNSQFRKGAGRMKFDIYHEPNILALEFDGPTVITVHDLSWIRHPEAHPAERVRAMNRYFESGLRRAKALITDSAFVKQELVDVFGVAADLISPIPLGVEDLFKPLTPTQTLEVLRRHQLVHGHYFLAVGTLEPRKNLALALNAYLQLPNVLRERNPLVLIGMKGWDTSALEQKIAPLVRNGQVRQPGYVERADLAVLMAGARTLVYPSLYEGFGLPPLESMACATPVICANASSLPEVVGQAGVLIGAHDDEALAKAMLRMVEDPHWRDGLARQAVERAASLTWERCVQKTMAVYRSIAPCN